MKKTLTAIAVLLCLTMPFLTACTSENGDTKQTAAEQTTSEITTETTEEQTGGEEFTSNFETATESETESGSESETETVEAALEGKFADSILNADRLKNGVQAYYTTASRKEYGFHNQNMRLTYSLVSAAEPKVTALKNAEGGTYLENTMDAFIKMKDGRVLYASKTSASARTNIFRHGYYYYDIHFLDQNFEGNATVSAEQAFDINIFSKGGNQMKRTEVVDGVLSFVIGGNDPFLSSGDSISFSTADFNAIQVTIKSTRASFAQIYLVAGDANSISEAQKVQFDISSDGEFHTYTVNLSAVAGYTGTVKRLRLDIEGGDVGDIIEIKDIKAVKLSEDIPPVYFDRNFHTYSDKMNQVLRFIATETVTGIAEIGMTTAIAADTVEKLIVKDANGTHTTLEGVDWDSAEYVGFDIKEVGIFGYILLAHENSGRLTVALAGDNYIITQVSTPENGTILGQGKSTENDYCMGQRLYTDESHTFDAFLKEAEDERNPIKTVTGESYVGYDALRGAYKFTIGGTGFGDPFFNAWNRHYTADISLRGVNEERRVYIYTVCNTNSGNTEGAVIMDENMMQIPIPTMIFKNFGSEDEEPLYWHGDRGYSETLFPIVLDAREKLSLTVVNTMQNWGILPLKQVSSIQYYAPYYHLSTGVTETTCIAPWYIDGKTLLTLTDFRTMSGPWWFEYKGDLYSGDPQHTHVGNNHFLEYTDAEGNYYASESIHNAISSAGQHYGEILMDYISDDGRIAVTYKHIEFPQTDEHRAFYEISYEVLEDISFKSFKNDFAFFSTKAHVGTYQKMGYLDVNNQVVHTNATTDKYTVLGDNCPYVSFYALKGDGEDKCGNMGFVIYSADMTVGGEKYEGNFAVLSASPRHYLTLDLDEVTLKKGDTMTINIVIVPWGSEQSADDSNMLAIRENTCLDPLTVTVRKGEAIESVIVPKVKTDDGKSAEFTLSGGNNNVAVRVYGFKKLTAPKLYELIGGEWKEYVTSSSANPDNEGNLHYYDGYCVYYDGDGTYSYTFPVDMTDAESRTFRIEAFEDFTEWPEEPEIVEQDLPLNHYLDAEGIYDLTNGQTPVSKIELAEDGSYIRLYGDGVTPEAAFKCFSGQEGKAVGQYLVIKYRFPTTNTEHSDFQFYSSTVASGAGPGEYFFIGSLKRDGEWHIAIIDMSKQNLPSFEANADGSYSPNFVRFDFFNTKTSENSAIDFGYIGISDNLEEIFALESEAIIGDIYEMGNVVAFVDFSTKEVTEGSSVVIDPGKLDPTTLVDPESGYKASDRAYTSCIDFVNGEGNAQGQSFNQGAKSVSGVEVIAYNKAAKEGKLSVAGWVMVHGGVGTYMWSADGGKSWHEAGYDLQKGFGTANETMVSIANRSLGKTDFDQYTANAVFQANPIYADLSAYAGQTVDVIFAVMPQNDEGALCVIAYISGVSN